MNKQEKQTKSHGHRQQYGGHQRMGGGVVVKGKGVKYMVMEDDLTLTLGGGHTV